MSENELIIKCKLCDNIHEYTFHSDKFNALIALWNESEENRFLNNNRPEVGNKYNLTLYSSLKLDLNKNFWIVFQPPYLIENGIEREEDVHDILFCRCSFIKKIAQKEYRAEIQVKIDEIKNLISITDFFKPEITWWSLFNDHSNYLKYGRTKNFNSYSIISINIQGDLGI
jgi:hypothetical protein